MNDAISRTKKVPWNVMQVAATRVKLGGKINNAAVLTTKQLFADPATG